MRSVEKPRRPVLQQEWNDLSLSNHHLALLFSFRGQQEEGMESHSEGMEFDAAFAKLLWLVVSCESV